MRNFGLILLSLILISTAGCSSGIPGSETYTLDIQKEGQGTIVEPDGTGEYEFEEDTIVTLKVDPEEEYLFSNWNGADGDEITEEDSNEWKLTMDDNKSIIANFEKKEYTLNISTEGEGDVQEKIVDSTSSQDYKYGTTIELKANSDDEWYFDHWEGDLSGSENPERITVDEDKEVTAYFKEGASVEGEIAIYNSADNNNTSSLTSSTQQYEQIEMNNVESSTEYKEDEIIIKYNSTLSTQAVQDIEGKNNLKREGQMNVNGNKMALYKIPAGNTVPEMVEKYREKDTVEWAEPNYIYHSLEKPDDPYYYDTENEEYIQWGNTQTNLEAAWDIEKGSNSVTVAVIDSGIIPPHEDLEDNLLQGADFVGGENEYPLDEYNKTDDDPTDETSYDNGGSHGTHVAGIIGAVVDNSRGVAGVNWDVDILPVRVIGTDGTGSGWDIIEGIYYAVDKGADVINMSLGGTSSSDAYKDALDHAVDNETVVFAATGNGGTTPICYPAQYDSTIAVGAVNKDYELASYSNYGPNVDLVAPGGSHPYSSVDDGIYSTWGYYDEDAEQPVADSYTYMSGTSMATPYASGVAALLIANGVSGVDNIKQRMTSTAVDLGPEGKDEDYGYGLVDAYGALRDKKLEKPDIFAVNEDDGSIVSEVAQAEDGSFQIKHVEPGEIKIYGWRDVNENDKLDAGDYFGETETLEVTQDSNYDIDLNIHYVTEETASSLDFQK
ncbi:MAG: S8 family serine peptidase [Bacillota bacterium]